MDYTPIHKIPCLQDESILKMNSDTTALMKGMKIHQGDRVLDIGTNQGALLLEVAQYKPSYMVGVDINPHAIKLAQHNMQLNEIHNVELIIADITTLNFTDKFDVIVCNPPFFEIHSHTLSPHQGKQAAKFSQSLSLTQLMKVIQQNLSLKGRAYIVFRSAFLAQCFQSATSHQLCIVSIAGVHDQRLSHYKSCVLMIQHGSNKPCHFAHPITL